MNGMCRHTGKPISGIAYLQQRVESCLTMRVGASVMRPLKGSSLSSLIDSPMNAVGLFELQIAALDALDDQDSNGLPDFAVESVTVSAASNGIATFIVTGEYQPDGKRITLEGIQL